MYVTASDVQNLNSRAKVRDDPRIKGNKNGKKDTTKDMPDEGNCLTSYEKFKS